MNKVLILAIFIAPAWAAPLIARQAIVRGPYLSCPTQSSITIRWANRMPAASTVEYGLTASYGLVSCEPSAAIEHTVILSNLRPSTEYHYRVCSGDTTRDFTFRTAVTPDAPVAFVVYGDSRTNHDVHAQILSMIEARRPMFILHTGDLVESGKPSDWDTYFSILCRRTTVGETIPVYSALGNHDEDTSLYFQLMRLPVNSADGTSSYYSFDYGSAHCACVNSNISLSEGTPQRVWLEHNLASAQSARFRFVFLHHPPYSSSRHGSNEKMRKFLVPLCVQYRVQVVFAGHDHDYERTTPIDGVTYIVTGGGGAPLYSFREDEPWTAYRESVHHFCTVRIDSAGCAIDMIRMDGSTGDSVFIPSGTIQQSPHQ